MIEIICPICKSKAYKSNGQYNRAVKIGANLYCSKKCSNDSRRYPEEKKKELKRLYDIEYRKKNKAKLKKQKAEYFKRDYKANPEKYKKIRKSRMKAHIEYCRRPEYRAYKKKYDREYRCRKYGEFSGAASVLIDLEKEVRKNISKYESMKERKVLNKTIQRSRNEKIRRGYT